MSEFRALTSQDISEMVTNEEIVSAVKQAYLQKAMKQGQDFPLIFHEFIPDEADMDIKSGVLNDPNCFGLKVVSVHSDNNSKNLPTLMSTTMVFNSITGELLGILDFKNLTGLRTAAAATIGAQLLARANSKTLLVVGCGYLAPFIIEMMNEVFQDLEEIIIYDPININQAFKLKETLYHIEKIIVAENLKEACLRSDIIISATPSRKQLIMKDFINPGTHLSCLGSDMSGKQELDVNLLSEAKIYVDDINQACTVGECEIAFKNKLISKESLNEIGSVLLNPVKGRENNDEITIFDASGISLQDIMIAYSLIEKANKNNIGQKITF
ncbi:ornithine cyclodeaminase family protein [Erysipelotrichaceae bacterium OttesenSCG-928-M19]|nr:ornithine cyclodeaminase family protein [Erysipelotrichaceae bacterium OttesenSCG-928-M19]